MKEQMTGVTIVTGCAGAGKTEHLLDGYLVALDRARRDRQPGTTLWLTPTRRIQQSVVQQIITKSRATCFAPNVLTFDLFAEKLLAAENQPASPISPVMKRLLLRRIAESLRDQGELRHFQPIAGMTGFLDVVSSFISEVKREEIWPEQFLAACQHQASAFARRDVELGLIYTRYQQHLTDQKWYDNEGRFWLARNELERGIRDPFARVQYLVVDGFADFTQTQYEILGYLAGWIDEILISLPVELPLTRSDLFSKPDAAVARIRKHLPEGTTSRTEQREAQPGTGQIRSPGTARAGWADSIRVVADHLFSNPRSRRLSTEAAGLEVISASGPFGEWEAIARRIKTLLSAGTDDATGGNVSKRPAVPESTAIASLEAVRTFPQDIVIGLRSISNDGPRLRDYLTSAGLPVWCEAELPFTSSSIVKTVTSLLQFELEDWPFERLLAVLDSNFFRPAWPEFRGGKGPRSAANALRRLRLDDGRELMLRVLARYASDKSSVAAARSDSLAQLATLASPLLARLSRGLDRFRRSHTLSDWADVLATVANDLGWIDSAAGTADALAMNEARDWDLLQRTLRTAAEADQQLTGKGRTRLLNLGEFAAELRDLLSHETLKPPPEPTGSIRILGVEQIRNLDVPHLFLIGLTENSFPMNRTDDCLFSESERQDFIVRGVPLRHRSGQHAEEMFLFYSVVTRARRSLTLSYPAVNSKGQPVFPSPYVTALTSLFESTSIVTTHEGQLDPVPAADRSLTLTDLRLAAMADARDGHPELFRRMLELDSTRRTCWNTIAACDVADHRFHQRDFTRYEGRLELAQNLDGLQRRFGEQHQFSATELEAYARCPFQFWLSTVLKIAPVDSPEEGTDYAGRGTLLHEVLATVLLEGHMTNPETLRRRFRELVDQQLNAHVSETDLQRSLVRIERLILSEWGDAFVEQQGEYDQQITGVLKQTQSLPPEIPFGSLPDAPVSGRESNPPIQFGHAGNAVHLRGRIDRVDVGSYEGHPAYVVIDYKSGQRPTLGNSDLITGRSIQLALYLLAIKRLGFVGPEAVPYQMGYWALHDTGFKPGMSRPKLEPLDQGLIQSLETLLDDLLPRLAAGIRSGRFVVENDDPQCTGRCHFRTVCRVNQIRPLAESLGKKSPVPVDPTASGETGGAFSSKTQSSRRRSS